MPKKIELGPMISSAGRQARPVVDVEEAGVLVDVERIDAVCRLEHATISPLIAIALMVVRNIALTAVLRVNGRVIAYYAWCTAQLAIDHAPARLRKRAGRYPQPVD